MSLNSSELIEPQISIPRKKTDDVDWTAPIRSIIAQSYGENPDTYGAECASLQRCRQDAVKGAGSEMTARDLLYKYFGQLELLELRFSEIKVTFPWCVIIFLHVAQSQYRRPISKCAKGMTHSPGN